MNKLLTIMIIMTLSMTVFAGDAARKGTAGAEQLLIPVGARSVATGGAFGSHFSGVESIYYNPAGLDRMKGTEAMFSFMNYIADINVSYFAVATQMSIGSIGLTYKSIDFGDIPVTTNENPDGTGQLFSPSYFVLGLTYSKMITDRVSAGFNFNLINETIMNTGATGWGIDFGVQYRFSPNFSLGVAVKNIGGNMNYTGEELKTKVEVPGSALGGGKAVYEVDTESFQIPSYFEMSLGYTFEFNEDNGLSLGALFRNNNNLEDEVRGGLEFSFLNHFHVRGGYLYHWEDTANSIYDWTVGAGLNFNMMNSVNIVVDYAYRNVNDFPTDNHVFTLMLGFN
ncbi:MAG: PorV/PorQ family protein [Bacteroidota bacterium]